MNGKPGSSIWINLDYDYNKTIPRLQKIYNMVHELGTLLRTKAYKLKSLGESVPNGIMELLIQIPIL